MKRWFRIVIISIFALAAVSLVVIQFVQTRRTFSISDNMFNVGVNNAMDAVLEQMESSEFGVGDLVPMITDELLVNGIDMKPVVGIYDGSLNSFLYSSDPSREADLVLSPYRYSFHPVGVVSANKYFIILSFPETELFIQRNTKLYVYMSLVLIFVIVIMFLLTIRTIDTQRRLDRMKMEFINNMTHEIKTPIATIGLACEMLKESADNSELRTPNSELSYIGIIADENQRMRVLVETILQSAKMSNKNFRMDMQSTEIGPLVDKVVKSFGLTLSNRGGNVETHLDDGGAHVWGNELHLTNLIYNLVDNGIKYSVSAPQIEISTAVDGEWLVLRVRDHGVGISKEDQRHVFEKFYRVSTGDVHNVKGFGIGLNYVAEVVRLHGGHISLESELGKGSTFTVKLKKC